MPDETRRLFFALRPDSRVGGEIERAAALVNAGGRVRGRWLQPSKYHMTVQFLGNHPGRPAGIIERACMAAARPRIAPFEVVLDRVATFDGHRKSPCVLRCTPDSEQAVEALRSALGEELATARLADLLESSLFTPHVTIAYVEGSLAEAVPVESIAWQVREFALVESHVRESRHEVLAQWQLTR
jgi:RNA 2',3'-cyclic 3'-phosphodiesterase